MTNNNQTKSKQRVTDHGEVFTSEREVNAMLDLVKEETERIDSRFLEPACGTGNFLTEILKRKLAIVKSRYSRSKSDYQKYAFLALTSIYGVELLADNITECRARLLDIMTSEHKKVLKEMPDVEYLQAIQFILLRNILQGDALTMLETDGRPIIFSEWALVSGDKIKRRDFELDVLMSMQEMQIDMFTVGLEYDEEIQAHIPTPIKEYPLVDYRRVAYAY